MGHATSSLARSRSRVSAEAVVAAGLALLPLAACGGERAEEEGAPGDTAAAARPEEATYPYDFSDRQRRAVTNFLRNRPDWRLLTEDDNASPLLERQQRQNSGYRPYFAEGDLSGDGQPDFALVFDAGERWKAVWFRGTERGYVQGQPVIEASWLDEGGLFVQGGDLVLGRFFSDHLEVYRWDPEKGRLRRHVPDAPELRGGQ